MLRPLLYCCLGLAAHLAFAAEYYVAPGGSDAGAGSAAQPWRSLQHAADTVVAGDTVFIRGGNYAPVAITKSGAKNAWITFRNVEGETPIIDGTGLTPPDDVEDTALVLLTAARYVRVQGLELRNYRTTDINKVPSGVFLRGACTDIQIHGCNIHHIENTGGNVEESGNAFGLAVYGSAAKPATRISIAGNEIHHLKTGASEALSINGNVTQCDVSENIVHDTNNIGIVFIGYEETAPSAGLDRARLSTCRRNLVYNVTSQNNQAYADGDYSAGGIYCDGSSAITIEHNTVHHCDIGVELASEHARRKTSGIKLKNNFIYLNRQAGIALGGYDQEGTGGTSGCGIIANTLYGNDTLGNENGEILLRWRTSGCTIRQNIIYAAGANHLAVNIPVPPGQATRNSFGYNLYYDAAGSSALQFIWNDEDALVGLAAWQQRTKQDRTSTFADPALVATGATPDLHLTSGSPAIDALPKSFRMAAGFSDLDGDPRLPQNRVDIGADEFSNRP